MKVSRTVRFALVCFVLLVSCTFPKISISSSPTITPISSSTNSQPDSTIPPSINVSPDSTHLQPSLTVSPQVTAVESTAIPTSTYMVTTLYNLDANFNYLGHALTVSEAISYTNYTTDTIADLILVVEPNRWAGSFELVSITLEDGGNVDNYELKVDQLHIPLLQPLQPGERLGLKLNYRLEFPVIPAPSELTRPVQYGYTERQTNIVDWYPYIPPYLPGKGWLVHSKWWFGEHQVFSMANFQVKITLTEPVQDLVIAASAPAVQDGDSYTYYLEGARTFALSASTGYLLQTTTVGDVTINNYYFQYDEKAGQQVLQDTAKALELYSNLLIPYPHSTLSVVEADFLDGMEYDGLFFLSRGFYNLYDGTPQGYLTFIAAHETAHQWWYGLVGNDQALEPWLDEAMCTYMEHIFYENVYADYKTSSGESMVDWWWYYRVNFYDPNGWVDGTIYDFNLFLPYRNAIYLNGAKFLQDLRSLVGDPTFFSFLKDYAIRNSHKISTAVDFFEILRSHTSQNLDGLVNKYFQFSR